MKVEKIQVGKVNGNIFAILGACRRAALHAGWSKEEWEIVLTKATEESEGYENSLDTLRQHFEFDII